MTGISYRFIKKPDARLLAGITALYKLAGWCGPKDRPALFARLAGRSHCFLAARERGRVIGMGRAISDRASDAYIQDVFVTPRYRGRGIGAAIIRRLKARLENDGITWIGLIAQDNSRKFYEPLGFKTIGRAHPMMLKGNHV